MRHGKGTMGKIDLDAFFQVFEEIAPFHLAAFGSSSGHGPCPLDGLRVRTHNRAPFHLAALLHVFQDHGVQEAGRGVHQGIAPRGGLAKNRPPDLIRRDEPPAGALPSNAILRFEKAPYTYHSVFSVQRCPLYVGWLFYRYFERCV